MYTELNCNLDSAVKQFAILSSVESTERGILFEHHLILDICVQTYNCPEIKLLFSCAQHPDDSSHVFYVYM